MARAFTSPPGTISEALSLLSADVLRPMMGLLSMAKPLPTRKADMVAAIESHLAGDRLRKLWEALDEMQQLAVSEALHTSLGVFDRHRFKAKYNGLPVGFGTASKRTTASPLHFFLYSPHRYEAQPTIIPEELAQRLRPFVPPPPEAEVAAHDDLPEAVELPASRRVRRGEKQTFNRVILTRRDMERVAQHDLLAVLRLIDGGRVAVSASTRRPSTAASRRIAEVLSGGDFFDPTARKAPKWVQEIGPIRAFAWPCLLQGARLAELRGSKLALTKTGRAALSAPAADTLRRIWKSWLGSTLLDEFSRVEAIKGQSRGKGRRSMTAASGRRPIIADALAQCPVGRWVRFDDFSQFMEAASFDFDVTRDPWDLHLLEPGHGSLGYDGGHEWSILQGRYLLCLLFEYAATLGLIDVAYTDPREARLDFAHMWGADGPGVPQPLRRPALLPVESAGRLLPGPRRGLRAERTGGAGRADPLSRPLAPGDRDAVAGRADDAGDLRRIPRRTAFGAWTATRRCPPSRAATIRTPSASSSPHATISPCRKPSTGSCATRRAAPAP